LPEDKYPSERRGGIATLSALRGHDQNSAFISDWKHWLSEHPPECRGPTHGDNARRAAWAYAVLLEGDVDPALGAGCCLHIGSAAKSKTWCAITFNCVSMRGDRQLPAAIEDRVRRDNRATQRRRPTTQRMDNRS